MILYKSINSKFTLCIFFESGTQFLWLMYLLLLLIFQVYIIGGDGTQKGAAVIFEVI